LKLKHSYNETCKKVGGKADFQCFEAAAVVSDFDSDDSAESLFPDKKRHKKHKPNREKPMIIVVCTPLTPSLASPPYGG
jgi:hypothetical protein